MPAPLQKQIVTVAPSANIIAGAETLIAYSFRCEVGFQTVRSIIKGFAQLTFPAGTTGIQQRIRRGVGITGILVAGSNTENATAAPGKVGDYCIVFSEQLAGVEFVDYTYTIAISGTGANTNCFIAGIEVELLTS
jgi:hypothetical protein